MPTWNYDERFTLPRTGDCVGTIQEAEEYVVNKAIDKHEFFEFAKHRVDALEAWVTQELIVTGYFSQLLLRLASSLSNVHLRTMLLKVAVGEHGSLKTDGLAGDSHPWLLHEL